MAYSIAVSWIFSDVLGRGNGGGDGIRTHDTIHHRIPAFQASAFNHSATPPYLDKLYSVRRQANAVDASGSVGVIAKDSRM